MSYNQPHYIPNYLTDTKLGVYWKIEILDYLEFVFITQDKLLQTSDFVTFIVQRIRH